MAPVYKGFTDKNSRKAGMTLGITVSGLLFLAIPLTQIFTEYEKSEEDIQRVDVAPPPPPPPEDEPPPPPEPEEEPPPEDLDVPPPPISLEQLEIALEAGTGEGIAGDFAMPNLSVNKKDLGGLDIFDINDLDKVIKAIKQVAPITPMDAKRRGLSGEVIVRFVVDKRGNVVSAKVHRSTHAVFDKAALAAVRQWKFTPGEKDGKVVSTRVQIPISFDIN